MKKKSSAGVLIAAVAVVVILGGVVLAAGQDWKTGQNSMVGMVKAQLGDPEALYQQGLKARSDDAAIPLLEKAAQQGHVKAMMKLADIYSKSKAEDDGDKELKWYKEAANAGNIEAVRRAAIAIGIGRGKGEPNTVESDRLMKQAAEAGDGQAQFLLGRNLAVPETAREAEGWLVKAAAQKVTGADAALGDLYYNRLSPLKDDKKALQWYAKGAEAGDTHARLSYSYMYFAGRGVKKDDAEAWKWLVIADDGDANVQSARDYLKAQIKPDAVAEGSQRAAAWKASHKAP